MTSPFLARLFLKDYMELQGCLVFLQPWVLFCFFFLANVRQALMEELEIFTHLLEELPYLPPLYHCWPWLCHNQFHGPTYPGCSTSSPVSAGFQMTEKTLPVHSKQEKKYSETSNQCWQAVSMGTYTSAAAYPAAFVAQHQRFSSETPWGTERLSIWGLPWWARQLFKVLQML